MGPKRGTAQKALYGKEKNDPNAYGFAGGLTNSQQLKTCQLKGKSHFLIRPPTLEFALLHPRYRWTLTLKVNLQWPIRSQISTKWPVPRVNQPHVGWFTQAKRIEILASTIKLPCVQCSSTLYPRSDHPNRKHSSAFWESCNEIPVMIWCPKYFSKEKSALLKIDNYK